MKQKQELREDQFELYDLAVVVEKIEGNCTCNMAEGDHFYLRGGKLSLPDGADFVGALFGTLKVGAVGVMVNPHLKPEEVEAFLAPLKNATAPWKISGPRFCMTPISQR